MDRVRVIDELTDQRKSKILQMARWDSKFQTSLDTWPCVNTMVTKNTDKCQACGEDVVTMLSQFYGQPYDHKTLRSKEPSIWDLDHKVRSSAPLRPGALLRGGLIVLFRGKVWRRKC